MMKFVSSTAILFLHALLLTSMPAGAAADDDEIGEVEELEAPAAATEVAKGPSWLDYRGYLVCEMGWLAAPRLSGLSRASAIAEGNLSGTLTPIAGVSVFGDLLAVGSLPANTFQGVLAQGGLRFRPVDEWSFAIGRERNFRAPGLLVNPSDFVHPAQTVPGQRMQRAGVWLARASYQTQLLTLDAMFLPFRDLDAAGIPQSVAAEDLGGVVRAYASVAQMDIGWTAGRFDRAWQAGLSLSRYLMKGLEGHLELGYREAAGGSALAGTRWDVGSTGSITVEGYYNGRGLDSGQWRLLSPAILAQGRAVASSGAASQAFSGSATSQLNLFPRQWYGIAGYQASEIWNRFNVMATTVVSFEDASGLGVVRWDWLLSDQATLGLLGLGLWGPDDGQYGARPADLRLALEWRVNF